MGRFNTAPDWNFALDHEVIAGQSARKAMASGPQDPAIDIEDATQEALLLLATNHKVYKQTLAEHGKRGLVQRLFTETRDVFRTDRKHAANQVPYTELEDFEEADV